MDGQFFTPKRGGKRVKPTFIGNGVCVDTGGRRRRNGRPELLACVLLFAAISMIAFAPPAGAAGPSGLVSPDHITPGSGDSFYVAHTPPSCGGWEIVHYFGDGTRDPAFHCASPDSCDTGAGGTGLWGKASRGDAFEGRVRGQAMDGETNQLYLLQDDGIHPYYADTGDSAGTKIDLPTTGQGFAPPPKSMSTNGSGASRCFYVVDNNGAVWKKMIGSLVSWDKYCNAPATASPDKYRDAAVKKIASANEYYLYVAYTDGIYWIEMIDDEGVSSDLKKDTVFPPQGYSYQSITFAPNEYAYVNNSNNNTIQKRSPPLGGNALTTFVTLPGPRGDIAYQPTSNRLLVAGATDGKIYQYSPNGTEIPWGASPTPSPTPKPTSIPAPTTTSTPTSSPSPTPSPAPTATSTPTPYSPPVDPPPLDPDQKALLEAMNILGLTNMDLQVLGALLLDDPNDVEPGGQDLLKDAYALVDFLGKLLLNEDSGLVSKIEDGSLSQETFDKALYTLAVYLQEALAPSKSGNARGASDSDASPLPETLCRGSVVEMTLKPGVSQGSFTTTFPKGTHEGEDGWRTQYLALLLNRGTKLGTGARHHGFRRNEGPRRRRVLFAKGRKGVKITVTDGLSYDWNDTAGIVRVAMTVMTIEIPDGATAPTPRPADTGGHGCSVVWPLGMLLLAPLLFVGPRR